jgi:hypothetical protein
MEETDIGDRCRPPRMGTGPVQIFAPHSQGSEDDITCRTFQDFKVPNDVPLPQKILRCSGCTAASATIRQLIRYTSLQILIAQA